MLTANQEQFVQNILQGMNQTEAYKAAYPKQRMSDKTIYEAASRLMKNPKVVARLSELRAELAKPAIKSAQERMEWLTQLIDNTEEGTNEKLKAVDILNKMEGCYVQKFEGSMNIAKLEDLL